MITRREFLTLLGVGAGGAALAYAPEAGVKAFEKVWGQDWVNVPGGPEKWITSVCRQCPGGCGIRVRLIGSRPTKIDGNLFHPINRGKLCPKGQAGLLALNDPDRIKGPLKRVGERGSGKWQQISWDEVIKVVVNRLREIRSKEAAHTLAILSGDSNGLTRRLLQRFLYHFGSPNYIEIPTGLDYGTVDAFYLMQGLRENVVYDVALANYTVFFGSDFLQSSWSPVQAMKAFSHMRRGKDTRGKVIQVESRYSITAAKADEWVPANPGTEGVLALGMAHFIIKEGLYDKDFVGNHSFGFEDWSDSSGIEHRGYKSIVLQDYSPSAVSDITGIPIELIVRLAREFATQRPALAIGTRGDIYQQMAVHALNGLVGNIDKPGGVLVIKDSPVLDLPGPEIDETARRCLRMTPVACAEDGEFPLASCSPFRFPDRILQRKPYDVSTLFSYNCNPLFQRRVDDFSRALEKIPFIVSFSPYMDETSQNSDLILPDHSYLEKWEGCFTYTFQGFPVIGVGKPVIEPLYDTKDSGNVLIEIANRIGEPLAKAFPWKDSKDVLTATIKKVYENSKGDLFSAEVEEGLLRELARRGWSAPAYKTFEEFWEGAQEKGGWWNPVYSYEESAKVFQTPSKKFEFYSQILKNHLEKNRRGSTVQALKAASVEAKGDQLFLPHWESRANASPQSEKDYPLHLKVFEPLVFAGLIHVNDPYLQDISSFHTEERWSSWVEINPSTAETLGIKEGEWVWLQSPSAKIKFKAKLTPGAMPHVVSVQMGLGHQGMGRWAKGVGENCGRLVTHDTEPFTGEPLMHKTRVKVYKA